MFSNKKKTIFNVYTNCTTESENSKNTLPVCSLYIYISNYYTKLYLMISWLFGRVIFSNECAVILLDLY